MKRTAIRTAILAATLLLITTVTLFSNAQQIDETDGIKKSADVFMAAKLNHTKDIVEGLALADFTRIEQGSQKLILLSHETNWQTFQTEQYLDMSEQFRGSAGRLKKAAKEENLDGATLAYFEVTLNCVRCHKYVRDAKK